MTLKHRFLSRIGTIFNSGQSRALVLTGNVFDWFYLPARNRFVPLLDYLLSSWDTPESRHFVKVVYELNGPIRFLREEDDLPIVREAWMRLHTGRDADERAIERMARPWMVHEEQEHSRNFEEALSRTVGNATFALEFLRQLCLASRTVLGGKPLIGRDLIILIEGADMLIPQGEISRLSEADRRRVGVCRDWFSDPEFMNGSDSVVLLAESKSRLNEEVACLPQLLPVEVPAPDADARLQFIDWFIEQQPDGRKPQLWSTPADLAYHTAGLSILSVMQLLKGCVHTRSTLTPEDIFVKVEEFLKGQLGEDVVEFTRPSHRLTDVVGNTRLKAFLTDRFIPRIRRTGQGMAGARGEGAPVQGSLAGAAVAGPIGSGKTFIFEAVAAELGVPVLTLKNLRSKWFGETDVIFERLRRCLEALNKVLIFMDEADTQLGGVGEDVHPTERRLTGKIQAMMSEPRLRGRVIWLLMTARIHQLSPDLRRPGRAGDVIIPVLDPEGDDLKAFLVWMLAPVCAEPEEGLLRELMILTQDYYAAAFASLREELIAVADGGRMTRDDILAVVGERILPTTSSARQIQALHAMLNCTHASLLPGDDPKSMREQWERRLRALQIGAQESVG